MGARRHNIVVLAFVVSFVVSLAASAQASPQAMGDGFRALEAGKFEKAYAIAQQIPPKKIINRDYLNYLRGESALQLGKTVQAEALFKKLLSNKSSVFSQRAGWRYADALWKQKKYRPATGRYFALVNQFAGKRLSPGDVGLARYRIALGYWEQGKAEESKAAFRRFIKLHPEHSMHAKAVSFATKKFGAAAVYMSPQEMMERAKVLSKRHLWKRAVIELDRVKSADKDITRQIQFQRAMTYFAMRRQYKQVGETLVSIYGELGSDAAEALFHGARALSRADEDKRAIGFYQRVVKEYPRSKWAAEAQFLSGWLEFNLGNYGEAVPYLEKLQKQYPRSKWASQGRWFLGFSYYLAGQFVQASAHLSWLASQSGKWKGGKGRYWLARAQQKNGDERFREEYKAVIKKYPLSWYALLARSRLKESGEKVPMFLGPNKVAPSMTISAKAKMRSYPLIRRVSELQRAGLLSYAAQEMRRGEKQFLRKFRKKGGVAFLLEEYTKSGNFHRPYRLASAYSRGALNRKPEGHAKKWWQYAYPRAYRSLVEKWQTEANNPPLYLYSIMRKESGFDPYVLSYADARGLLQMIPATTKRVVEELGMEYNEDLLYKPSPNIRTAAWYNGKLYHKFRKQIPLSVGSFNSGPRPVMRWIDKNGERPMDEFVELVSYRQTREYMKKVTENFARYQLLYEGKEYWQPLIVDKNYVRDELTY